MHNAWAIARREFRALFNAPVAYIAITVFLALCGLQFFYGFLSVGPAAGGDFFENNEATVRPLFEGMALILAIFLPAITMRLVSEERRSGTLELLATMPVTDGQIVLGKYVGALLFLLVALALTLSYPLTVSILGDPDNGTIVAGYVGVLLIGAGYTALGVLTSTWTSNQIVAFVLGALLCTFFYLVDSLAGAAWEALRPVLSTISFRYHFANFARGIIDSRDVVFFAALITLALMLARYSLESRNWK